MAGERPHFRLRGGGPIGPSLRNYPPIQAVTEASRTAADTLLRPAAHVCHVATWQERKLQDSSEVLGHASIALILDVCSHVLPNMQSEAAKAMEDALS